MSIYVTYLTIYSGNKLPPFYIGSSSLDNINNGYRGSVQSKQYEYIWKEELKQNPHLFKTKIISNHDNREDALEKELLLQTKLNVVKSPLYINMALAQKNGYFGMSTKGKILSDETKRKISNSLKGKSKSVEHRKKISEYNRIRVMSEDGRKRISEANKLRKQTPESNDKRRQKLLGHTPWFKDKKHSEESKRKMSEARKCQKRGPPTEETKNKISESLKKAPKKECPYCGKIMDASNYGRYHGDMCKYRIIQ